MKSLALVLLILWFNRSISRGNWVPHWCRRASLVTVEMSRFARSRTGHVTVNIFHNGRCRSKALEGSLLNTRPQLWEKHFKR